MKLIGWVTRVDEVQFQRDGELVSISRVEIEGLRLLCEKRVGDPSALLNKEVQALVVVKWPNANGGGARRRPVFWVRALSPVA